MKGYVALMSFGLLMSCGDGGKKGPQPSQVKPTQTQKPGEQKEPNVESDAQGQGAGGCGYSFEPGDLSPLRPYEGLWVSSLQGFGTQVTGEDGQSYYRKKGAQVMASGELRIVNYLYQASGHPIYKMKETEPLTHFEVSKPIDTSDFGQVIVVQLHRSDYACETYGVLLEKPSLQLLRGPNTYVEGEARPDSDQFLKEASVWELKAFEI